MPDAATPPPTTATEPVPIAVAYGDGIGPEIVEATLRILEAAEAPLRYDTIEVGEAAYLNGHTSGIAPETWDAIRRHRVLLKGPITTPQGGGYKSLNVTLRKSLGMFANVRPNKSYAPFVAAAQPGMNLVIIRENEEDTYAGIEHRQTTEVYQTLKLITRPGSEAIVRYAFEYARAHGRRKVTCMSKDNIMKLTDGLFHRVFDEIAPEYPEIEAEHRIIDIGAAIVAARPEVLDVVVAPNLYGDIISDIAAEVSGSVGVAGSANVGSSFAMFEAIHGSAPDIAGRGVANPSGLLNGAVMMLVHLGMPRHAETIKNAWLATLEAGIHTPDIYRPKASERQVSTEQFTDAVIERLGERPKHLKPVEYREAGVHVDVHPTARVEKALVGVDVFLDWDEDGRVPDVLGGRLSEQDGDGLRLKLITNRGVKVYPDGLPETFWTDHWRCRFVATDEAATPAQVVALQGRLVEAGFDVIKTENLYTFDGERAYSLAQGE
ncbi:NADP-dependent isocitrate dehydrogenase [Rubrivirga sp. S365]|uniref:Isocitrate dehydrogenase [NADP] n=1 Tax=Rubrivirga litoralis TaxID=3075598 RepID=A0ABU3BV02_9BACT|nr:MULTISPECIES: NADP-dependent isocitrate dehydrogenase [unclassified Rubrivirga]MDT0633115.1 NADP-dependent isocitrate dehydrogenase [Rubrivirga sp. F394]MDT7857741.1 NADP-dependent isocitrate dehydrogenase [Rubrivirga sp. S365]